MKRSTKRKNRRKSFATKLMQELEKSVTQESETEDLEIPAKFVHDSHSFIYYLLKYPILSVAFASIVCNFVLYVIVRLIVTIYETARRYFIPRKISLNFDEFVENAKLLDKKMGLNPNKLKPHAYDETLIKNVIKKLKTGDIEAIRNDLGGIENEKLYSHCHYGTTQVIDEYYKEAVNAIETVDPDHSRIKKLSLVYGRTALCLSGGATLSWHHLGVLKALLERKLLPSIIAGTSAGSLIAAMVVIIN